MKKFISVLFVVLFFGFSLYASLPEAKVYEEKENLETLTIEYFEEFNQARFTFTMPASRFDKGNYIKKSGIRIKKFQKDHGYKKYTRNEEDIVKYNEDNTVTYICFILFK
ncbi:MAG: hypothetical protein ACTTHG_03945 [Treponemataceae bacterium]